MGKRPQCSQYFPHLFISKTLWQWTTVGITSVFNLQFSYLKRQHSATTKNCDYDKPLKQICMQPYAAKVKIAQSTLILKFFMTPSAAIFFTSRCNYLRWSPENFEIWSRLVILRTVRFAAIILVAACPWFTDSFIYVHV